MKVKRVGEILVEQGVISSAQIDRAMDEKMPGERVGDCLIRLELVSEMQMLAALEKSLNIERISLPHQQISDRVIRLISEEFAREHNLIPLRIEGRKLYLAVNDPLDFAAFEQIRALTGYRPRFFLAPIEDINNAIEEHYSYSAALENLGIYDDDDDSREYEFDDEETPIIQIVNQILSMAVKERASDIHVDPKDDRISVRYRIDGELVATKEFPERMYSQFISRIKVMAGMDITESRVPQDGRIRETIEGRNIDLRISTLPTVRGEKVVMRILDLSAQTFTLSDLKLTEDQRAKIERMIKKPNGIILVSGPTGSGKSTTLYSFLRTLNKPEVNIITVEDPVEIRMEGLNQVQVDTDINLTFARVLRSVLRQDPNIIMVGEIRDSETAEMATRASLTGHLVLSTIHTNDAVSTVARLVDAGVQPFLVATSLSGIIAQRLVRKVCPHCAQVDVPNQSEVKVLNELGVNIQTIKRAVGCEKCSDTGYSGRVAIFEILEITPRLVEAISAEVSGVELERIALDTGMEKLIISGLRQVAAGATTMEEVFKVVLN